MLEGVEFLDGGGLEKEPEKEKTWPQGLGALLFSVLSAFLAGRVFVKKSTMEGGVVIELRNSFDPPSEILTQIELVRNKATGERRPVNDMELEIFALIPDFEKVIQELSPPPRDLESEEIDEGSASDDSSESSSEDSSEKEDTDQSESEDTIKEEGEADKEESLSDSGIEEEEEGEQAKTD
jgi:hypothetical protein